MGAKPGFLIRKNIGITAHYLWNWLPFPMVLALKNTPFGDDHVPCFYSVLIISLLPKCHFQRVFSPHRKWFSNRRNERGVLSVKFKIVSFHRTNDSYHLHHLSYDVKRKQERGVRLFPVFGVVTTYPIVTSTVCLPSLAGTTFPSIAFPSKRICFTPF